MMRAQASGRPGPNCKAFVLAVLLQAAGPSLAQDVPADLYVPAAGDGPFPVAVVGHAYVTEAVRYAWLGEALADAGWIVAVPRTQESWDAHPALLAADLAAVREALQAAGADADAGRAGRLRHAGRRP